MRIVVAYKWASNPQEAVVSADGEVSWSRAKPGISQYDPVAMELARQLADETGGEVIGLTAGTPVVGSAIATKSALARGLDRVVVVTGDSLDGAGTTESAAVLAAAVRRIGDVDLVVTGDSSMDVGAKMVPNVLAGFLGWPAVADVDAVTGQAGALRVERAVPGGVQVLELGGPSVIATSADAAVSRVPGMRDLLAAGKKPVEHIELADLDLSTEGSTAVVRGHARPELKARRGQHIDASDPEGGATELVSALRLAGAL